MPPRGTAARPGGRAGGTARATAVGVRAHGALSGGIAWRVHPPSLYAPSPGAPQCHRSTRHRENAALAESARVVRAERAHGPF